MSLIELANPQAPVTLDFFMDGPAFENGIPVHIMVNGIGGAQSLLDRAYLGLAGRRRFTSEERTHFFLVSKGVNQGSLDTVFDIILTGVQTSFPVLGALGPAGIWEYAKQAYELLKIAYDAVAKDEQPRFEWNADKSVVQVNTGNQTNIYNAPVYNIAQLSQTTYVDVSRMIDRRDVDHFRISEKKSKIGIELAANDARIFLATIKIEEMPIEIECEIFDFNKFDDTGKVKVGKGQPLPENNYRFEVIGAQNDRPYIEAMLKQTVKLKCLKETSTDPLSGEKVVGLQVISIAA